MALAKESQILCTACGNIKKSKDFNKSFSDLYSKNIDSKLTICKECIVKLYIKYLDAYGDRRKAVYYVCRKLDACFLHTVFEAAELQCKNKSSLISIYIQKINSLKQYKGYTFDNSNPIEEDIPRTTTDTLKIIEQKIEDKKEHISPEALARWGNSYSKEQIIKLENFCNDMKGSYKVETASHKDYLFKIARTSLKMDEALDKDDVAEFEKLSRVYDSLMKSAKFTAVQRSAVDDAGGFATISEFVDALERDGFIPPYPIEENMDIVENTIADMKQYTKNLVLGDSSISTLAQETLLRMKQKEDENHLEEGDLTE